MKRTALGTAVLVLLVATACGASGEPAATVNGSVITDGEVNALVYDGGGDLPATEFAGYLGILVQWTAIEQGAEAEFGISPSGAEIDAQVDQVLADFGFDRSSREDFFLTQDISEAGLERYARLLAVQEAVEQELTPTVALPTLEDAQQALADDAAAFTEVCAAHILLGTEEEAEAALARVHAGERFADLAAELSLDGSGAEGGELGCGSPLEYVPSFADATMVAEIGEVFGPVESEFGFHLIVVTSRTTQSAEEVLQLLVDEAVFDVVDDWMLTHVLDAEVEVAERHGTWITDPSPQVLPAT